MIINHNKRHAVDVKNTPIDKALMASDQVKRSPGQGYCVFPPSCAQALSPAAAPGQVQGTARLLILFTGLMTPHDPPSIATRE